MIYTNTNDIVNNLEPFSSKKEIDKLKSNIVNMASHMSKNKKDTDEMIKVVNANINDRLDDIDRNIETICIVQKYENISFRLGIYIEALSTFLSFGFLFFIHLMVESRDVDIVSAGLIILVNALKTLYLYHLLYKKRYNIGKLLSED